MRVPHWSNSKHDMSLDVFSCNQQSDRLDIEEEKHSEKSFQSVRSILQVQNSYYACYCKELTFGSGLKSGPMTSRTMRMSMAEMRLVI